MSSQNNDNTALPSRILNEDGGTLLIDEDCRITFERTIRIPDDNQTHALPPAMGTFPLFNVEAYKSRLPKDVVAKGGVFIPMYQREAMWLRFYSRLPFAIRPYVGGVNGITGDPTLTKSASGEIARKHAESGSESKQDYLVVPLQPWLDGIAIKPGVVRQFVAMPAGSGYSVEHQVTGEEVVGGLQFEIIPIRKDATIPGVYAPNIGPLAIKVQQEGKQEPVDVNTSPDETIKDLKFKISCIITDISEWMMTLKHDGKTLEDEKKLSDYDIKAGATLQLTQDDMLPVGRGMPMAMMAKSAPVVECAALSADFDADSVPTMSLAAGGQIDQKIYDDTYAPDIWDPARTTLLNVQLVDSVRFEQITGRVAPETPVSMQTYVEMGGPMFGLNDQHMASISGEGGNFEDVKSVAQIDQTKEIEKGGEYDESKVQACGLCKTRMREILIRPCSHFVCRKDYDDIVGSAPGTKMTECPVCKAKVDRTVGIAAPMNVPDAERLNYELPVITYSLGQDGRPRPPFRSVNVGK